MTSLAMQDSQFLKDLLWWQCPHCAVRVISFTFHMRPFVTVPPPSIYSVNTEKQKNQMLSSSSSSSFAPIVFQNDKLQLNWFHTCLWDILEGLEQLGNFLAELPLCCSQGAKEAESWLTQMDWNPLNRRWSSSYKWHNFSSLKRVTSAWAGYSDLPSGDSATIVQTI